MKPLPAALNVLLLFMMGCGDPTPSTSEADGSVSDMLPPPQDMEKVPEPDAESGNHPMFRVRDIDSASADTCPLDNEDDLASELGIVQVQRIDATTSLIEDPRPYAQFTLQFPAAGGASGVFTAPDSAGGYWVTFSATIMKISDDDGSVLIDSAVNREDGGNGSCAYATSPADPEPRACRVIVWMESRQSHGLEVVILDNDGHPVVTIDFPTTCRTQEGGPFGEERPFMTWLNWMSRDTLIANGHIDGNTPNNPLVYDRAVIRAVVDGEHVRLAVIQTNGATRVFGSTDVTIQSLSGPRNGTANQFLR